MGITVLDGDFQTSAKISSASGGIEFWGVSPDGKRLQRQFAVVEKLEFVNENISGGGFSPLWGIIGQEAIGPAGLLLGVNGKKAQQTVYFKCTLDDGRYFVGSTSAKEFQRMRSDIQRPPLTPYDKLLTNIGAAALFVIIGIFLFALVRG